MEPTQVLAEDSISIGSIEYIYDGLGELFVNTNFSTQESYTSLGTSAYPWSDVYATSGTVNTSDTSLKTNIKSLEYGLKEIMEMSAISYEWKNQKIGSALIPQDLRERKIGFNAQELLNIIPEVVKTHDWYMENEETQNYVYKKNKKLGVYYSDLIPVLTKAIQEQQSIIESLKFNVNEVKDREDENLKLILELRQEIDALRNELNNKFKKQ